MRYRYGFDFKGAKTRQIAYRNLQVVWEYVEQTNMDTLGFQQPVDSTVEISDDDARAEESGDVPYVNSETQRVTPVVAFRTHE